MISNSGFELTCNKTFREFEEALYSLAKNGPVFMSQVHPILAREGFDWVGSPGEGVRRSDRLDVKYDFRYPTPVDFLVLRHRANDEDYLRLNPKFYLAEARSAPRKEGNKAWFKQLVSRFFVRVHNWFRFHKHMHRRMWNWHLEQLKRNSALTVYIRYLDQREGFTAGSVLSGDDNMMLVRKGAEYLSVNRREVSALTLVPRATVGHVVQGARRCGEGKVKKWSGNPNHWFMEDTKTGERLFFAKSTISDGRLLQSLFDGKYGQVVRYSVIQEARGTRDAVAQVVEMIQDYLVLDPKYKEGHDAMIAGNLDDAAAILKHVIATPESKCRLSAIKDCAEVLNRKGQCREAIELIEQYRGEFPEQSGSFDMMEITYLERIQDWQGVFDKTCSLLGKSGITEGQRRHYEQKQKRLQEMIEGTGLGGREELAVDIEKCGLTLSVIDGLRERYGILHDFSKSEKDREELRIFLLKLADFVRARSWNGKLSLGNQIDELIDTITLLPLHVRESIDEAKDEELNRWCSEKAPLVIEAKRGKSSSGNEADVIADIYLSKESAVPIKNIRIMPDVDRDFQPCFVDDLAYDDGRVRVELKFVMNSEEVEQRKGELRLRIAYDKDVDADALGTVKNQYLHDVVLLTLNFSIDDDTFDVIRPNPYESYCNHVAKGAFFVGRQDLLNRVYGVLAKSSEDGLLAASGQSYVLYGQARSGKSSIRNNLSEAFEDSLKNKMLYTEVSVHAWTEGMIQKEPMEYLAYDLKVSARRKLKSLGLWGDAAKAEFSEIPNGYFAKQIEFFGDLLRENGILWIVAIDEFTDLYDILLNSYDDDVAENRVLDLLRALKGILESQRPAFNLLIIGQDSMPQFRKKYWNKFSVSREERISYLEKIPTIQLLQKPLDGLVEFEDDALELYYEYVGGYPLYSMYFCARVVDYINEHKLRKVGKSDVIQVAESFCTGDKRLRPDEFDPFVQMEDPEIAGDDLVELYYAIARSQKDEDGFMGGQFSSNAKRKYILDVLQARGVVKMSGERAVLRMGLFAKYIYENPGLTYEDIRSAKGWYHDR